MTQLPANPSSSPFDAIRHEDEQGEYWMARELAQMLGYVNGFTQCSSPGNATKIGVEYQMKSYLNCLWALRS